MDHGPKTLVIVLAGGAGGRLSPLTERRAKPAVPFGGMYRLIDVALSNVTHSRLSDVWVIEQYEPHALNDHLANGRPWDLDRTHGGLQILPPFEGRRTDPDGATGEDDDDSDDDDSALASGNADALVQHRRAIDDFAPDVVLTMSADHVYRLDLRDVLDTHVRTGARLTIVTTDPPADEDGSRFAWVYCRSDGTVEDFEYKPEQPGGDRVCTEIFAFDGPTLLDRLHRLEERGSAGDYGDVLVPELVADGDVVEHVLDGYWRDVGTLGAYHRAHMELLGDAPPLVLDDRQWPLLTGSLLGGPARVVEGAEVVRSLLSPGSVVAGAVRDSVIGRDVVVELEATVLRSVLLDGAVVRSGTTIEDAIVDVDTTVESANEGQPDESSGITVFSDEGAPASA